MLRYAEGQNPNGSSRDIAGVCQPQKNVMGLMPHPEHAVDPLTGSADGGALFESVAAHVGELGRRRVTQPRRAAPRARPHRRRVRGHRRAARPRAERRSSWPCSR